MKKYRLLFALFAGTLFYVAMDCLFGPDGIRAFNQMNEQKRILSTHTVSLEKINDELNLEKIALEKDSDVISAYAKKLGFVGENEKLVKISGLNVREKSLYDTGSVLRHKDVDFVEEKYCKISGFIIFLLVYVLLLIYDFSKGYISLPKKKKYVHFVKGTAVYDMQ